VEQPSYQGEDVVENHKHCVVCGKVVAPDKFFCSQECEGRLRQQQKRMSRMRLYMMLIFFVLFILILVLSSLQRI
jgi:predicted nucleic acid-binding Zn ribbon protein